jgi:hypothetical protein
MKRLRKISEIQQHNYVILDFGKFKIGGTITFGTVIKSDKNYFNDVLFLPLCFNEVLLKFDEDKKFEFTFTKKIAEYMILGPCYGDKLIEKSKINKLEQDRFFEYSKVFTNGQDDHNFWFNILLCSLIIK